MLTDETTCSQTRNVKFLCGRLMKDNIRIKPCTPVLVGTML